METGSALALKSVGQLRHVAVFPKAPSIHQHLFMSCSRRQESPGWSQDCLRLATITFFVPLSLSLCLPSSPSLSPSLFSSLSSAPLALHDFHFLLFLAFCFSMFCRIRLSYPSVSSLLSSLSLSVSPVSLSLCLVYQSLSLSLSSSLFLHLRSYSY